jgi:hypothetical protein
MPKKRGWKLSKSKAGELNPKKKKKRLTDLTGDTGSLNSNIDDMKMTGDTGSLNSYIDDMKMTGDTGSLNSYIDDMKSPEKLLEKLPKKLPKQLSKKSNEFSKELTNAVSNLSIEHSLTAQSWRKFSRKQQLTEDVSQKPRALSSRKCQLKCNSVDIKMSQTSSMYPFNATFLKFGSFHQNDKRFKVETRGNQCTCNALVFLALGFSRHDPTVVNLDTILNIGDQVYENTVHELKRNGKYRHMLLNLDEVPTSINTNHGKLQVDKKDVIVGSALNSDNSSGVLSLHQALAEALKASNYMMIWIGAICSAVQYHCSFFYFFDSHSHTRKTLSGPEGRSILIGFNNIDNLINYMYALYTSMHIDLESQI